MVLGFVIGLAAVAPATPAVESVVATGFDWGALVGPAVVAAGVSGIVTTIGFYINRSTSLTMHEQKLEADQSLAERKFVYDRQQAVFKRRFEFAEQLLADAYRFRAIMKFARNGVAWTGEGETREALPSELPEQKRQRDVYFVPLERLKRDDEFLGVMFARRMTAQALFGPKAEDAFALLHSAIHVTRVSATMLIESVGKIEGDTDLKNRMLSDIWEGWGKIKNMDEVGTKIEKGVSLVEELCTPVLAWVDKV